jgi:hypothetical protein
MKEKESFQYRILFTYLEVERGMVGEEVIVPKQKGVDEKKEKQQNIKKHSKEKKERKKTMISPHPPTPKIPSLSTKKQNKRACSPNKKCPYLSNPILFLSKDSNSLETLISNQQ